MGLSIAAIDKGQFREATAIIEDALLLTLGREDTGASFLRLRVPSGHLLFAQREKWEQHPANVLEAAYINLAYATSHEEGYDTGRDILEEGLELAPSSIHLKHALARLHLSSRRAQLADPLYAQLDSLGIPDTGISAEVRAYRRVGRGGAKRR